MSRELEPHLACNLRRWQESTAPRRWVEAHHGRWDHQAWQSLLSSLEWSEYGWLPPEEVGRTLEEARLRWRNLRRWQQSGLARAWVAARAGCWGHEDWLHLVATLRQSQFWPLDLDGVGEVLGEIQQEWHNLHRWRDSEQARQWVEQQQGQWDEGDWLILCESLRRSAFWPLDPEAARGVLNELTTVWWNLRRWQESGQVRSWVEAHQGQWGHEEWLQLLGTLQQSQFWPLEPAAVGRVLEQAKAEYWNLRRWWESGELRRWVAEFRHPVLGNPGPELVESLRHSPFWPVDPDAVLALVESYQSEGRNLRHWLESGEARRWVAGRRGRWGHDDWLELCRSLQQSPFWPVDLDAVAGLLGDLNRDWWNLNRWRVSGQARRWVEARQGTWNEGDWQDLLAELQGSGFWPVDPLSLHQNLEEMRQEWENLQRWRQTREPQRWVDARGGCWNHREWLDLVQSLQSSDYWPLDLDAVSELIESLPARIRQAA
jgi:hypothetical protein